MAATPTDLRLRYPAFRGVANDDISYWLDDALVYVSGWGDEAAAGQIEYAAHHMVEVGVPGIAKTDAEQIPAGVTKFKSGTMDVAISEAAANRSLAGGYASTVYGQRFLAMQRRNAGGPYLVGCV